MSKSSLNMVDFACPPRNDLADVTVLTSAVDRFSISVMGTQKAKDSSITMDITPACDESNSCRGSVHFSDEIKIIQMPDGGPDRMARVTFSDGVVDIEMAGRASTLPPPSAPKKQVRFSCLKKRTKMPLSPGLLLLQKLKRRLPGSASSTAISASAKRRVRFGALKCHNNKHASLVTATEKHERDEDEARRASKDVCLNREVVQPLRAMDVVKEGDGRDST